VNGAVLVGAENLYVCIAQAIEEFFTRMAVRVLGSGGNNCEFRMNGSQKLGRGRVFTAMMADLQDVSIEWAIGVIRQYCRLRLRLGVTGKKEVRPGNLSRTTSESLFLADAAMSPESVSGQRISPFTPSKLKDWPRVSCWVRIPRARARASS
jgi:hypothetical protein